MCSLDVHGLKPRKPSANVEAPHPKIGFKPTNPAAFRYDFGSHICPHVTLGGGSSFVRMHTPF